LPHSILIKVVAVAWAIIGIGWGYWGYRRLLRRFGLSFRGRWLANIALMTGYFISLFGSPFLWTGGHQTSMRGGVLREYDYTWSQALVAAVVFGLLVGTALAYTRRLQTYEVSADTPLLDDDELAQLRELDREGTASACRRMAEALIADSRKEGRRLPEEAQRFVDRHLGGRLTREL